MNSRRLLAYAGYHLGIARYLFIHIPKNAGTAMRHSPMLRGKLVGAEPAFYRSSDYLRDLKAEMQAKGEHHGIAHARLQDISPKVRQRLQPVAVVRNPWARVVSRYRFARFAVENGKSGADYAADTFEAFLEERHKWGNLPFYWHRAIRGWYNQTDYVLDESGKIAPHILRQEFLGEESQRYFNLSEPIATRNKSGTGSADYRDYYTARTIAIVADWYKPDIELWGFDFDTAATRNAYFSTDAQKENAP